MSKTRPILSPLGEIYIEWECDCCGRYDTNVAEYDNSIYYCQICYPEINIFVMDVKITRMKPSIIPIKTDN